MNRIDWRSQVMLMFRWIRIASTLRRTRCPRSCLRLPWQRTARSRAAVTVTPLAKGVWDLRVGNNNG
jgi:hypothetical protein